MRKVFLSLVAVLLCNVVSFAQSDTIPINSAEDFLKIGTNSSYPANGSYQQTADIDLGTFTQETAIIPTFSGTYDGNGYSITYQASFTATNSDVKLGLFGTVTGTIKNLKLTNCFMTCSMTVEGDNNTLVGIGLLCGYLDGSSNDVSITDCNIINGTINSTISTANWYARVATGLIAGKVKNGFIKYSSATGSVTGCGYVGGLIGQTENGDVVGSSFVGAASATFDSGNWWADAGSNLAGTGRGAYVGGIIGFADNSSSINLCYVKADIEVEEIILNLGWFGKWDMYAGSGLGSTINDSYDWAGRDQTGTPLVTNSYAEGTVNGKPIDTEGELTNSANDDNEGNYYEGETVQNCTKTNAECIAENLNAAVPNEEKNKIQFSVSDDDNVIFGVVSTESVCETPTNLTITKNDNGTYTASWEVVAVDEGAPSEFVWTLKREEEVLNVEWSEPVLEENVWSISTESPLDASLDAYTFYVKSKCSEDLFSEEVSIPFYVDCPTPTGLTASDITDNGFTISWDANVDCQVILNSGEPEVISSTNNTKTYENLLPETTYNIIVKAKCGEEYVKQASINVTTARLAAPTGLAVTTGWDGSAGDYGGSATISWTPIEGLTYEVDTDGNTQTRPYQISSTLAQGSYTAKVRAKKGDKYSDWASIPYTVSSPNAPSNPVVTYPETIVSSPQNNVTVSWTPGENEGNITWKTTLNDNLPHSSGLTSSQASVTALSPGDYLTINIVECVNSTNFSKALVVPIQVPCLDASEPTSIVPALNSVTFNFEVAKTRKIFIGSAEYDANATSVTIDGLTEGTSYAYEIREYCNPTTNTYSSISSTFSTLACFAVKNLSVSNIGVTNATISWGSQSTLADLNYQITVNEETKPEQTDTTITLTGLTSATEYTIVVKEQCGEGWGDERRITFTTMSSDFETIADGEFDNSATWKNGNIPTGDIGTITINHIVSLYNTLILKDPCKIINKGVLVISQHGELINTTGTNVGGIIEIVSPIKGMNQWTFIGAPFADDYTLGCIIPNTNDIGVVRFNYEEGEWKTDWERTSSEMKAGEGYFAWPFYAGVVTYTTYGDVGEFNATTNTWYKGEYDFTKQPDTELNNADFQFKRDIPTTGTDHWMALSNPYPAKLSVSKFLTPNTSVLQGGCTYSFNGTSFDINNATSGNIEMTEGFFVNCQNTGSNTITFSKSQLTNYPSSSSKSSVVSFEFIELTLQNGKDKVRVYFAQNEDAEQGYDILDANKMFATTGVAEPYFVTDGIALIKEEVAELPYYATMNVRSQEDTVMNFVLTNLPEGYAVSIIDGEEVIDLVEGGVYSTEIASGENADRFKVLVKKNVGLADVEELDVRITNSNRHITITAQENVRTEVYNTLGQKVFETEDTNFVLSGVASGAYVVKVQGAKASKSQKIVVE